MLEAKQRAAGSSPAGGTSRRQREQRFRSSETWGSMSGNEGMRAEGSHEHRELRRAELHPDPIRQFLRWFDDAESAGIVLPNAMALATTRAAPRTFARFIVSPDEEVVTRGNKKAPRITSSGPGNSTASCTRNGSMSYVNA